MAPKTARLEARLTPEHRDLIQQAASLHGLSLSDFVLTSSLNEARKVIAENEILRLSRAEQLRFADALLNPKPATKGMKQALAAHRKLLDP